MIPGCSSIETEKRILYDGKFEFSFPFHPILELKFRFYQLPLLILHMIKSLIASLSSFLEIPLIHTFSFVAM